VRRRLSDDDQRRLISRGGALAALSQHPSWPDLVEEIQAKRQRLERVQLTKALSKAPVDQRELDFVRGFIAGMEYLVEVPSNAEARLESFLKEHGVEGAV